ncbi:MAG: permease prefix domain 1-containing protein [Oscillospiraceae bacterium]|nr:permease prefix domain 1-containing protein [Oscillospiraceae bacterium]
MENKIRDYVEDLFADAPQTKKVYELKEEMVQNLIDKYRDLLAEGMPEDAAYNIAVAGIGDVGELIRSLEVPFRDEGMEVRQRNQSAAMTAIAVIVIILSVLPVLIFESFGMENIGICLMLVMVAAGVGLLIYTAKTKPQYRKKEDTMVEDFKAWQADQGQRKNLLRSISSALWTLTLAAYFVLSFMTGAWHISWVLFLIAAAAEQLLKACFDLRK